jgi:hypothetical protein
VLDAICERSKPSGLGGSCAQTVACAQMQPRLRDWCNSIEAQGLALSRANGDLPRSSWPTPPRPDPQSLELMNFGSAEKRSAYAPKGPREEPPDALEEPPHALEEPPDALEEPPQEHD